MLPLVLAGVAAAPGTKLAVAYKKKRSLHRLFKKVHLQCSQRWWRDPAATPER